MLKHVVVSPHRARADTVSIASSTSLCSLGSLAESRHDSLMDLVDRATTIKVFARCLREDVEYKTLRVFWSTRAREVVTNLLAKFRMRHRDPRLFYLCMEVRVPSTGLRTTLILDDDAKPAALQACHPRGYSRFSLQMRPGGLIKIYDTEVNPSSQYKSLLISDRTTSDELIALLLQCSHSREPVERFSLYEVCGAEEKERKLHPDDYPLSVVRVWPDSHSCRLCIRRNVRGLPPTASRPPRPTPRSLPTRDNQEQLANTLATLTINNKRTIHYEPVYKYPSIITSCDQVYI